MIFLCRGSVTEACHDSREVQGLQQQQAVGVIRQSLFTWNQHPIGTMTYQPVSVLLTFLYQYADNF